MSDDMLKHLYNACNPNQPATAEYFLDCSAARGSMALTREFRRRLELKETGFLYFLFSGHIGCGKSSELLDLKRALAEPKPGSSHARYFPVLLDVSEYLDDFDVTLIDLLLAIVTQLAASLREDLEIELKDNYVVKRLREVKELALSEVDVKEGELTFGMFKVKVQALKRDPDLRAKVRAALQPHMTTMLEEINLVFDRARLDVKNEQVGYGERRYEDLVLIVDNLEKIVQFEGIREELESHRELFLERYPQLTGINSHVIYTVPLRLVRSHYAGQLPQRYSEPFVLPMVKIKDRVTHSLFPEGVEFLHRILKKRTGHEDLNKVFTPEALDFLVRYSGGHMRYLMMFVQNACAYAEQIPIPLEAAHRSIQQTVRLYSTSIPESHWAKLAELDRSSNQMIPGGDEDYLAMLANLSVLEYINGDGKNDPFSSPEPWYAVHPIVRELQKFKSTARAQEAKTTP